jgi:hypothetical protein
MKTLNRLWNRACPQSSRHGLVRNAAAMVRTLNIGCLAALTLLALSPQPGAAEPPTPELLILSSDPAPEVNPSRHYGFLSWPICNSKGGFVFNSAVPTAAGRVALFTFAGGAVSKIVEDRQVYWTKAENDTNNFPLTIYFEADAVIRLNALPVGVISDSMSVLFPYPLRPQGGYALYWPDGIPREPVLWQSTGSDPTFIAGTVGLLPLPNKEPDPDDVALSHPPGPENYPGLFPLIRDFLETRMNNSGFYAIKTRHSFPGEPGEPERLRQVIYAGRSGSLKLIEWEGAGVNRSFFLGNPELARDTDSGFFLTHPNDTFGAATLFRFNERGSARVIGPGDPLPQLPESFNRLELLDVDEMGNAVIEVRTGGLSHGLWQISTGGTPRRVAPFNTPIETSSGTLTITRLDGAGLFSTRHRGGRTAFAGRFDGLGVSDQPGVFKVLGDGSVEVVYLGNRKIHDVPYVFPVSVGDPRALALNPQGSMAFLTLFSGGPVTQNRVGLFIREGNGAPQLIFHVGQVVSVREANKTVAEIVFDPRTALDDSGALHFRVWFTDGQSAIYRVRPASQPPPPKGTDFHWAGVLGTDKWHDLADGSSNWKDELGNEWPHPPNTGSKVFIAGADQDVLLTQESAALFSLEANSRLIARANLTTDSARLRNFVLEDGIFNVRDVTFDGNTVWSGGTIQGNPGTPAVNVDAFGIHSDPGSQPKVLKRKTFFNEATVGHFGDILEVNGDAEIRNAGDWTFYGDGTGLDNSTPALGGALFRNIGRLRRLPGNSPASTNHIRIPFENEPGGRVSAEGAVLSFSGGGKVAGNYTVADGGQIHFEPADGRTFEVEETVNFSGAGGVLLKGRGLHIKPGGSVDANIDAGIGAGRIEMGFDFDTSENARIDGTFQNRGHATFSAETIQGSGEFRNVGTLFLGKASLLNPPLTFLHAGTWGIRLVNERDGRVVHNRAIFVESDVEIENQAGAMWSMNGFELLKAPGSSNNRLINKGVVSHTGSRRAEIGVPFLLQIEPGGLEPALFQTVLGPVEPPGLPLVFTGGGELAGGGLLAWNNTILLDKSPEEDPDFTTVYTVTGESVASTIEDGIVEIGPSARLHVAGGTFKNHGTMRLRGAISSATDTGNEFVNLSQLSVVEGASIGNLTHAGTVRSSGRVTLQSGARIYGALINERGGRVAFSDVTVAGKLINEGDVLHDISGSGLGYLSLTGVIENFGIYNLRGVMSPPNGRVGRFENKRGGTLMADGKAGLDHPDPGLERGVLFENQGTVQVGLGDVLLIRDCVQIVNGVLTGGRWIIRARGLLNTFAPINRLGTGVEVYLDGEWDGFRPVEIAAGARYVLYGIDQELPEFKNDGTVEIGPGGGLNVPGGVTNSPESVLDEIDQVFVPASFGDSSGSGPFAKASSNASGNRAGRHQLAPIRPMITTPVLNNSGLIRPGGPDQAGPFNLTGNLVQTSQGRIQIELGGLTPLAEHDQIRIFNGAAALAGRLEVNLIGGFIPMPGQQFVLLITSGPESRVSGAFDSVVAPEGLGLSVSYLEDRVVLTVESFSMPVFSVRRNGAEIEINWSAGVLETSSAVTGPWSTAPGASSPFRLVPEEAQRYFRVRQSQPE